MIKTLEKFKEKKNRLAVISGEGNLPNQIIKELILNNIDPFAFIPNHLNLSLDIFLCASPKVFSQISK